MVSRVTYCPGNYSQVVEECLSIPDCRIAGMLVFDNRNRTVLIQGLKLLASGALHLGAAIICNWFMPDPKIRLAWESRIPLYNTSDPHSEACLQWLRDLQPDLLLHARTRCILKPNLLQIPRLGAINVHHGLLPETCGTMCDLRLLLQGRRAGFSLHRMIPAVDRGPVFSRVEVADAEACGKNYWTYLKQSARCEARYVRLLLEHIRANDALPLALPASDVPSQWYTTPTFTEFKTLRREGWKL